MNSRISNKEAENRWKNAQQLLDNGLLSVIMPAHNLGAIIASNIQQVHSVFAGNIPFEIIVVNDGSGDHTGAEIEKAAAHYNNVRSLHLRQNSGKGAALRRGFAVSKGNLILLLDADLDLPPQQSPVLFDEMSATSCDVVIGSKRHRDSVLQYPVYRRIMSSVYYFLVKLLIGLPVKDTQTGIKLFRRSTLEYAFHRMLVKQYAFDLEILSIIKGKGFRITEAPVILNFQGKWGLFKPNAVIKIILDTLAIFYRTKILRYYQSIPDSTPPSLSPSVSVVIACPAPSEQLEECLRALDNQTYTKFETIILPDKPTGRNWPDGVREIPTGAVRPAEKRNRGIEQSGGDIVAFLDDDAFPLEDWLESAMPYFGNPDVAGVGGPASTPSTDPYLARIGGDVLANPLVSGNYRYRYTPERVRNVEDYPSCNLFVRKETLLKLGGFRTDFWPGEDTYLCLQITRDLNMKIVYDPRVHVCHHRRGLFLPHLRQIGRYALHRGYFARHFPETSRKLSYFIPSIFVCGLICGSIASFFMQVIRGPFLTAIAVYTLVTLASCISINPLSWCISWLGLILTHFVYGVRFVQGLLASEMPSKVAAFDHASEKKYGGHA